MKCGWKLKLYLREITNRNVVLQSFYSLTFDKENEMVTYISNLRNIANILNRMDVVISDSMIISKVLATLPEEYGYFASARQLEIIKHSRIWHQD